MTNSDGLPAEPTPFIGRRRELAAVRRAMDRSRLVTLCGPGGVGKTRLALRTAATAGDGFPGGTLFVELSALREPDLLTRTVATALGLPDTATGDPLERLAAHLADRRMLLVLDACEHLIDACARLAETLVRAAPGVRILATSRELLDVVGEHHITVEPMPVPAPDDPLTGEEYDAVALFAERAAASAPGFVLTPGNRAAVTRLCRRTEGLPLAIELAAVRLATTPVERLADRLDASLRLRGHHQRAAVEWSRDLCDERERLLWGRLSVFPGDFGLDDATAVCSDGDGGPLPAADLPAVLARLVGRSLVRRDGGRHRMLDTLREYGAELLAEHGELDLLRDRHLEHFTALARRAVDAAMSPAQLEWHRRLRAVDADLRVALERALAAPGRERAGRRLAVLLRGHWYATGRYGEGRDWHRRALAAVPGDTGPAERAERGWTLYGAGMFAVLQGDMDAGDPWLAEALEIAGSLGDARLRAHVLHEQGRSLFHRGRVAEAEALFGEADALYARDGRPSPDALTVFVDLAAARALSGDPAGAVRRCERALTVCDATGERWARSFALWMRGAARWLGGDPDGAEADVRGCLREKVEFDDLVGVAMALDVLMVCAATRGAAERAAVLAGATDGLWETLRTPVPRGPHYADLRAGSVRSAVGALDGRAAREALARGRAMPLADAVAFGLSDRERPAPGGPPEDSARG
ncbi:ATP-binding protein [Actinomadura kijaniata]|uniref:ATP-binding protein n=1 Tax=Actinomadura kijaniata TaxID=46161 RepID=UPI003F198BA2